MTDDALHKAIRAAAAEVGWHDRATTLQRAHQRILQEDGKPPVNLYARLERVWDKRISIQGAC